VRALPALLAGLALLGGCSSLGHGLATALGPAPHPAPWRYEPAGEPSIAPSIELGDARVAELLARFAPAFVIEAGEAEWNRIGMPTLTRRAGIERARVDPARAALFAEVHEEEVGGRLVDQLVYRIHFDQLAFTRASPLAMHRNAGLLVLIGVDRASGLPLTVTSVHSCGCWLALQPTEALAPAALPEDWPAETQSLWGEELAARLPVPAEGQRYVVHLRSGIHRVSAVRVGAADPLARPLPLRPMAELRALPVEGRPGERASFFYEAGYLEGFVKGAWVPLEGLTLGLLTLDPRLGMDRDFGDPRETGARFSTAIVPWKRERTRLDRFEAALAEQGFRVEAFAPAGMP